LCHPGSQQRRPRVRPRGRAVSRLIRSVYPGGRQDGSRRDFMRFRCLNLVECKKIRQSEAAVRRGRLCLYSVDGRDRGQRVRADHGHVRRAGWQDRGSVIRQQDRAKALKASIHSRGAAQQADEGGGRLRRWQLIGSGGPPRRRRCNHRHRSFARLGLAHRFSAYIQVQARRDSGGR